MKTDSTLTVARLHELMRYEADGTLHWRALTSPAMKPGPVGAPAGHGGRLQCRVEGVAQYMHRLVWLYHHGEWPPDQLDHVNGDKLDNRIENLRPATNAQNLQNRLPSRGGVTFDRRKAANHWRARIMLNGRSINLGYYATRDEAEAEYLRAKEQYHPFYVSGMAKAS